MFEKFVRTNVLLCLSTCMSLTAKIKTTILKTNSASSLLALTTVNDLISAWGAYLIFHILAGRLFQNSQKLGIQIFHLRFKIKYHPSIFEKYRIFT